MKRLSVPLSPQSRQKVKDLAEKWSRSEANIAAFLLERALVEDPLAVPPSELLPSEGEA